MFTLLLTGAGAGAAGLFYLWFDPKLPTFHLQSIKFSAFNVTSRAEDEMTFLSSAAVTRVEAKNPNAKLELYYGPGRVEVAAGAGDAATGLGGDDVAGFFQGRGNVTSLRADVAAKGVAVEEGVGKRLRSGFKSKGLVVGLRLKVRIGYVVQGIRVWSVRVRVVCGGVSLKRLRDGDAPKCAIEVFKWYVTCVCVFVFYLFVRVDDEC